MKTKTPTVTHLYLCLLSVVITSSHTLFAQQAGTVQAIPTFQSIGLYLTGTGGDANTVCNVKYRVAGSDTWLDGYPLWFDSRAHNANDISGYTCVVLPGNQYRGSIVGLIAGTNYEIQLTAGAD